MRAACVIFVALSSCSLAYATWQWGGTTKEDLCLRNYSQQLFFNESVPLYLHINNCHDYNWLIHKIQLFTWHGKTVSGELITGGPGYYWATIKMYGNKSANMSMVIWGVYERDPCKKEMRIYKEEWDCADEDSEEYKFNYFKY